MAIEVVGSNGQEKCCSAMADQDSNAVADFVFFENLKNAELFAKGRKNINIVPVFLKVELDLW